MPIFRKNSKASQELKILGGWRALPAHLKLRLYLAKCYLQRKKYPVVLLRPAKGGLFKILPIRKALRPRKVVKFENHYFFSLTLPSFPSKPFDSMMAKGGLNIAAAGTPHKKQVDVAILAITRKCPFSCQHCYERFNLAEEDTVSVETWREAVRDLQEIGVNIITFSGGEPLLRFDALLELLESGDKNLSDFHVHTSGYGLDLEKALELRKAGLAAAGIGLDDVNPERHDALRRRQGSHQEAVRALEIFSAAGIFTYTNLCLTKELVRSGDLMAYLRMARDLNVGTIRLLEPKPYGGYFPQDPDELFSEEDRERVVKFLEEANTKKEYRNYPVVSYLGYDESPERLGCIMGGLALFYVDSLGYVEPCVFLPVSFGNIREEKIGVIFKRMREAVPAPLRNGCPAVSLFEIIKSKYRQCGSFPIPYPEIKAEWEQLPGHLPGQEYLSIL